MIYFYDYLYILSILHILLLVNATENTYLTVTKINNEDDSNDIGIQFTVSIYNNSTRNSYEIELNPVECCIELSPKHIDCRTIEAFGGYVGILAPQSNKAFRIIAPTLNPIEKKGSCYIYLDTRLKGDDIKMRNSIKINFHTKNKNNRRNSAITNCSTIDQNPLNECKPVNCELFYNGQRSFYDKKIKRCIKIPNCIPSNNNSNILDVIYDPRINKCVNKGELIEDLFMNLQNTEDNFINNYDRMPKDIYIIKNIHKKPKLILTKNNTCNGNNATTKNEVSNKIYYNKIILYLEHNKYMIIIICVLIIQSCLMIIMAHCLGLTCCKCGRKNKKLERQYYNCFQETSVTTPLISTSTTETNTTDFQYENELIKSSNIKCYKSLQNPISQQDQNIKTSLSDDVLTKCINRRDWKTHVQSKSDTTKYENNNPHNYIDKLNKTDEKDILVIENVIKLDSHSSYITTIKDDKTVNNLPNSFDSNTSVERENAKVYTVKETSLTGFDKNNYDDSEEEIKCHSFSNVDTVRHCDETECNKRCDLKRGSSVTIEKKIQASFSNDTIDDYISERGAYLLDREDISKYSFNSNCSKKSISEVSNKTSKNNILKNIISSILHKNSKHSRQSDPGVCNKNSTHKQSVDVELLHMSQGSLNSSSYTDSGVMKAIISKVDKESRASL